MKRIVLLLGFLLVRAPGALTQEEQGDDLSGYAYQEERVVLQALEEVLARPEYERLRSKPEPPPETTGTPAWLERLADWLAKALGGEEEQEEDRDLAFSLPGVELLLYGMAAVILAVVVVFLVKSALAVSRDRRIAELESEERVFRAGSAPGEVAPDEYLRLALEHGDKGRYKDALRELLLGAMSAVERRGAIRFRRGLTNRDYYYAVRGPVRESFGFIASRFEHVYFGRREATAEAFHDCCREYQRSFREAAPA